MQNNNLIKIKKNLDVVFNNSILKANIIKDKNLQKAVETCLNIYSFIVKNTKDNYFSNYVKNYETIIKKKFNVKNIILGDDEITDQINWLNVYCKNQYSIDISTNKKISNNTEINEKTPEQAKREEIISNVIGTNVEPTKIMELQKKIMDSNSKLNKDIASGKVFIYKSKPRIIPIIKFLFNYVLIGLCLSLLIYSFFGYILCTIHTNIDSDWVIYSSALIFATYLICSIILNYKIKLANNDNIKYYLKWQTIMLILIFLIFFVMIGMIGVTSSNSFVTILEEIKLPHNDFIKVSLWFNFIAIISTCVFILWLVILIILAAIFNPKRDDKKIGELYKEYLKNSSTI
ncbi:MAG: hypothetical protein LBS95_00075 [Mycoplasmataceae bacterium]|nr:hypothetical protein [Mycoplasmataceae bacterium]